MACGTPLKSQYMLNWLERTYDRIKKFYGPRHFAALVVLMFVVSAAGIAIGIKYTRYIQKNPDYCNSCHLMRGVYSEWASSDHKSVACQECHKLTVFEQDTLLIKHIIYGKTKIEENHGKKLPWESCSGCHWEQKTQGKEENVKSYGHFRHDFLECFDCHSFVGHNFPSDPNACARCHRGKKVHGAGMERLLCVDCHIFSLREGTERNRVIPTRQRCLGCHAKVQEVFPTGSPMSKLECFACHDPHGEIKPKDSICTGCHKDLTDKGHVVHVNAACSSCHKAHTWKVQDLKATCSSCHGYRDPSGVFPNR
jgi:hypothetical protein